jgi:predicted RNA-binding protein
MADSKLTLPGNFTAGKKYLIDGATLKAWQDALRADRIIAGAGLTETGSPLGRVLKAGVVAPVVQPGSFYGTLTENGHTYLQGGTVQGGEGTETIDKIKIRDAVNGLMGGVDDILYIRVTGNGVKDEDVLLGGYEVTGATTHIAANMPDDTLPTVTNTTGRLKHLNLGVFTADGFYPNTAGDFSISYCPGAYSTYRL